MIRQSIFPPVVVAGDDGRHWYSVDVALPPEVDAAIRVYVEQDECMTWTTAIHGALYGYRATIWSPGALEAEYADLIQARLADVQAGRTIEVTPEFWADIERRGRENLVRMRALRAEGRLGNLLLPQELWEFIGSEIASGQFNTPTDVVCAAMPYLRPSVQG